MPDDELKAVVDQIGVFVDLQYEFFDAGYYNDQQTMQNTSVSDYTILSNMFGQLNYKKVAKWHYNFLNSALYNPPFLKGKPIDTYVVSNDNFAIAPLTNQNILSEFGYANVILIQDNVMINTRTRRNAFAGTFLLIGAFISMLTRVTNLCIGGFQGFTADKSLIESLYSWRDS